MDKTNIVDIEMAEWRHDVHRHPEVGFVEFRTASKVAELLRGFGLEVHTGIGQTGLVAVLRRGTSNRSVGLRADMDALPILEANDLEYKSENDGVFHGCGHDGHTVMLLGAAKRLSQSTSFDGTVIFIFQPNEEEGLGANAMIDDGLFERFPVDSVYGMHNMPGIPVGEFAVRKGPIMAFEDNFVITVTGRGGHASMPHISIDPMVIGAEIVLALQTIVARTINPQQWGVVSVTELQTDGARNVLPSNVVIKGDTRGIDVEVQELIERRIREIVEGVCTAHGAEGEVVYSHEFVVMVNTDAETDAAVEAARRIVGENRVNPECPTFSCSEDFARMLQVKPGCYILIGNGEEGSHGCALHNPNYDFNDEILALGADYWVSLVETLLPSQTS